MAGSLKWFLYTDINEDIWAIFMDESNGEAVGNNDFGTEAIANAVPRNIDVRKARYSSADGRYARDIPVSTPELLAAAPATITVQDGNGGTVVLLLRSQTGERYRVIPTGVDTGIDDGDAT